ncbi:lytic transglycosylase domain-containing protein [Spirosoma rigui]|uniref:lytic transglycosylase domain-containing protein n=1 Tax=Spirosoma rigui TaxID=564064 RepID=UPI0009B0F957|nr:lytic transglycosylase domain-containing protein [Spirosoma rigui]
MTKRILLFAVSIGIAPFCGSLVAAQPIATALALTARASQSVSIARCPGRGIDPVHFCGELLPVDYPAITSRWLHTLSRQAAMAGSLIALKRRASVVFPLIEPILKQYQIPSDFKFLPLLESALTNRAVSRRGAAGFWQLMPQTAHSLGLTVSHRRDERFNLSKATHAACRYLSELYRQLGSWMLVASAYNAGPTYINQLSRQHPTLHPMALPYRTAETKAYLFQAVAIKELLTHPQAYREYLNDTHLVALSEGVTNLSDEERAAILTTFDTSELPAIGPLQGFVADSTTAVVLLMDEETDPDNAVATAPIDHDVVKPVPAMTEALTAQLVTRSLNEGAPTEGKLYLFQVVKPVTINGRSFSVGDVIQAHIELIDRASGRLFLRTDQYTSSQETVPLNLVATGQPRRPGVELPARLENWQLTWESL